ncbi:MAG: hypothetical protein IJU92_02930 [Spirochaetaceae bacterium]|nr:hypothetical protein [Spirochaetaceae bacterium]
MINYEIASAAFAPRNDDLILYSLASDALPNSPLSVYKLSSKTTLDKTPTTDVQ